MRATKFEFEKRFWIFLVIYAVAFFLTNVDHVPMIVALRRWLEPSIVLNTHESAMFARIVIFIGALLVFLAAALRT